MRQALFVRITGFLPNGSVAVGGFEQLRRASGFALPGSCLGGRVVRRMARTNLEDPMTERRPSRRLRPPIARDASGVPKRRRPHVKSPYNPPQARPYIAMLRTPAGATIAFFVTATGGTTFRARLSAGVVRKKLGPTLFGETDKVGLSYQDAKLAFTADRAKQAPDASKRNVAEVMDKRDHFYTERRCWPPS